MFSDLAWQANQRCDLMLLAADVMDVLGGGVGGEREGLAKRGGVMAKYHGLNAIPRPSGVEMEDNSIDPTWSMTTLLPTAQQPSFVKVCPDNTCIIAPEPAADWTELYQGAEYVSENAGQPMTLKRGYTFWKEWVTQPSCIELIALMNMIPLLYVPKALCFATVAGF